MLSRDRHMRIERIVLEHHRDVPLLGRDVVDDAVADRDRAGGDVLEPGEHAQKRRLAAAGGADQDDELAVLDRNRNAVQDFKIAERFPHVADLHRRHLAPSSKVHDASRAATVLFFRLHRTKPDLSERHCRQFVRFWQFVFG